MLAEKVKNFISANSLISDNDSVLVAFSGGADSMCLLHILKSLSYKVYAAHLNHGLRGKEADRDEKAARDFCFSHNIPFFSEHADISAIAEESGISEETAGRNERYKFFTRITQENNIDKIATAHNKNDNAETILMHIIRGTGTDGLSGIPKMRGNIVRPLLCCLRSEIEDYCNQHNLTYVTDSTNLKNIYTRNKIRLELIPDLSKYNTNILSALSNLGELALYDKDYFDLRINDIVGDKTTLCINKISGLENALLFRIISRLCENAGISPEFKHIKKIADEIKSKSSGKSFDLPGGFVELSCGRITANKLKPNKFSFDITSESEIDINNFHIKASDKIMSDIYFVLPENLDIKIRSRLSGDKIKVRGMTKKLSDLFIDKKIPSSLRDTIPILTVNGEIFYVFGIEKSDLYSKPTNNDKTFVLNISNKEYTNE